MSIDLNRKDFEVALEALESASIDLTGILDGKYIEIIDNVANEYSHLIDDVEEMVDENDRLQELVDKAELE